MSAHIVRKVWFRSVRKLRILRSSAIKWLCYAALVPCFCASFHVECHTCAICAFMAKSCSECRFCRAWLSAELLFQVLGAVSSSASAKCCPSRLGRYIFPISARKMFPVSVRLWVYAAETLTRCVRKSGGLEQKIFVLVSHETVLCWPIISFRVCSIIEYLKQNNQNYDYNYWRISANVVK